MDPIPGVQFVQADFLAPSTEGLLHALVPDIDSDGGAGEADVILCDMAGNSTGNTSHDIESSLAICTSVFEFTKRHMRAARSVGREMGGVLLCVRFPCLSASCFPVHAQLNSTLKDKTLPAPPHRRLPNGAPRAALPRRALPQAKREPH
jgi:hypothetical protein